MSLDESQTILIAVGDRHPLRSHDEAIAEFADGRPCRSAKSQKVNIALDSKPGGCVVWLIRREDAETCRKRLSYLYFGGAPDEPLPSLDKFKPAKHTKADLQGVKKIRSAIRVVPKSRFTPLSTTRELVEQLFGL